MMRTFWNIKNVDLGFDPRNTLVAQLSFPQINGEQQTEQENMVSRRVLEQVKSLPGVASAALVSSPPPFGGFGSEITIPGKTRTERWTALINLSSEKYFEVLHLRLFDGRVFSQDDVSLVRPVTVIRRELARKYFGTDNPIGQTIHFEVLDEIPKFKGTPFEVIGVVADVKNGNPKRPPAPEAYITSTVAGANANTLVVRSFVPPLSLIPTLRKELWQVDSDLALVNPTTIDDMLQRDIFSSPQFEFVILSTFAAIALALLLAGIFSVMAYTVSLQTHEVGIRMALGARPESIMRMVLRKGARLSAIGIVIGVGTSLAVTKFLEGFLFGIQPTDSATFVVVSIFILVVALLACWVPARRAMRVDPMVALRHE